MSNSLDYPVFGFEWNIFHFSHFGDVRVILQKQRRMVQISERL